MAYSDGASTNTGGSSHIKGSTQASTRWASASSLPFGGAVAGGAPF